MTETQSQTTDQSTADVIESDESTTEGAGLGSSPQDGAVEPVAVNGGTGDPSDDADVSSSSEDEDEDEDEADGEDDAAGDGADGDGADSDTVAPAGGRRSSVRRLEEEGEVAADYLEELLDIADIDGDIDIDVENGRASVGIVSDTAADRSLRRLVGPNGEVLEALQELTRLAVQAATGERSRLMLDVAGHRANRRRTLEGVAARACQEVLRTGEAFRLDPMTAFERKVVHDVVAEAGLASESEGEDPNRRVVINPAS